MTMKKLIAYAMALSILLAIPGMAFAKEKEEGAGGVAGKVTEVDVAGNTITVSAGKKGEEPTVKKINVADATITVDGASAKLADVTVGMRAKIKVGATPDTATAVDASTKKPGGKKGEKTEAEDS